MPKPDELQALAELLAMLVTSPRTGVLLGLLALAAVIDQRTMRLPNWLTGGGTLYALGLAALHGGGSQPSLGFALAGAALGLALLMPLYLARVLGAGDVKLMGMVGAFLGPFSVLGATLASFIAGGVLALGTAVVAGSLRRLGGNVRFLAWSLLVPAARGATTGMSSVGKLPYGLAICAGTTTWLVTRQLA